MPDKSGFDPLAVPESNAATCPGIDMHLRVEVTRRSQFMHKDGTA